MVREIKLMINICEQNRRKNDLFYMVPVDVNPQMDNIDVIINRDISTMDVIKIKDIIINSNN